MSTRIPLTLACGDYEIIRPLKEGVVRPDGIDLTVLTAMDSTTRHWRFLRGQEFDMAEASCSSFIVARDQGFPAAAIPVFLHRRFRHGFVFINTGKGIKKPTDLIAFVKRWQISPVMVVAPHYFGTAMTTDAMRALSPGPPELMSCPRVASYSEAPSIPSTLRPASGGSR